MVKSMRALAIRLRPIRYLFVVIGAACTLGFVFLILSGDRALDPFILPLISVLGWCIALFGIASALHAVPEPVAASDPLLVRIRKRLSRMLMWLWSASFILLSVLMLYVTYNTLSLTL
ncbi:MAG: hypothetical protein VYA55_05440 [Pseudomonadota bacterium]|nr:hypothetical protein [Pseudomonadota bacterium]